MLTADCYVVKELFHGPLAILAILCRFYSLLSRAFGIPFVLPVEFGIPRLAERELTQ